MPNGTSGGVGGSEVQTRSLPDSAYIMIVSYPINISSSVFKKASLITFRLTELKAILFLGISP